MGRFINIEGNILDDDAHALVNTVNCKGVMGSGLALQFKEAYEDMFEAFKQACTDNKVQLGKMHVWKLEGQSSLISETSIIINFPTKHHWKDKSQLKDIKLGLQDLRKVIAQENIDTIAIPQLGCGLGGLDWAKVEPLIMEELLDVEAEIRLYKPVQVNPAD